MVTHAEVFQSEARPGVMTGAFAALPQEVVQNLPTTFVHTGAGHAVVAPIAEAARSIPAKLIFPKFGYSLPVVIKSIRLQLADTERLVLQIELDEGIVLKWVIKGPVENGKEVVFERTWEIACDSPQPRAHFVASTVQALLLLDQQAELGAPELQFFESIHIPDSLNKVSAFLQHRQLAYRLMVIEKAFNQEFSIPQFMPRAERSTVDFVYRALTDRSFAWPFWQEPYPFLVTEAARKLLLELNGAGSFRFETDCFQQGLLGQILNLGEAKVTVQNAALVNPDEVKRELQQLDGHSFEVLIKSLSGAANYEFLEAPRLSDSPWDERTKQLLKLEDKLDEQFFEAVNQLAAASLDEETALEQEHLLADLSFDFSDDDDSTLASEE
jgi:hypothetical protein